MWPMRYANFLKNQPPCRYKRDDDVSNTLTADVKEESIKDLINEAGSNKKSAIKTFIEENERGFVCE